jgi:aspartate-semialdehyde dehydrogenase
MYKIAIIGATGIIGNEILSILEEREFPVSEIFLIASNKDEIRTLEFNDKKLNIIPIDKFTQSVDLIFSAAIEEVSRDYVEKMASDAMLVIDKTEYFRNTQPLIMYGVNSDNVNKQLFTEEELPIIATPNCVAGPIAVLLNAIKDKIKRVVISTYQSASGNGMKSIPALYGQISSVCQQQDIEEEDNLFPRQLAFNVVPQIGYIDEYGHSNEEIKITREISQLLGREIKMSVTSVRVPTIIGHAASVNIELHDDEEMNLSDIIQSIYDQDGVYLLNNDAVSLYPTPFECIGSDGVFIGRARQDMSVKSGFSFWAAWDNIRIGAALNAVLIAEKFLDIQYEED